MLGLLVTPKQYCTIAELTTKQTNPPSLVSCGPVTFEFNYAHLTPTTPQELRVGDKFIFKAGENEFDMVVTDVKDGNLTCVLDVEESTNENKET